MYPFTHTSITLYANPNHFMVLDALYSVEGRVFGWGMMLFESSPSSSIMKALDVPRVWQQFMMRSGAQRLNDVEPSNKGTLEVSSNSWCQGFCP
jgi:hypothetical protein